jgi:hypothetical protein
MTAMGSRVTGGKTMVTDCTMTRHGEGDGQH